MKKIIYVVLLMVSFLSLVSCAEKLADPRPNSNQPTTENPIISPPENTDSTTPPSTKEFIMTARQWEFEPSSIKVNVGDTVKLIITSTDVTHGIRIPAFDVSERLTSGNTIEIEFVADKLGTFDFFCSVQCGSGHGGMNGQLIVE